jgi:hypothetical protein
MSHDTDYEEQTFDSGVRGVCTCGWEGDWHHEAMGERFDLADDDCDEHLDSVRA